TNASFEVINSATARPLRCGLTSSGDLGKHLSVFPTNRLRTASPRTGPPWPKQDWLDLGFCQRGRKGRRSLYWWNLPTRTALPRMCPSIAFITAARVSAACCGVALGTSALGYTATRTNAYR